MQFCCPHCGQDYYGTGQKGHLVPEAFLCVKCGQSIHMNDMVLLPTEGIDEEQTSPQQMPWLNRQRDGWWRSWWSTVRMSLTSPDQLMRGLPGEAPVSQAWRFAAATLGLALAGMVAVYSVLVMLVGGMGGGGFAFGLVPALAIWVGVLLAGIAVWAAVAHLFLVLTGGTRYGFGRTCEAVCYSAGASLLIVVPMCGVYVYWIWWLVSVIIMLKQRQRVHAARATLALLALPVLMTAGLALTIWFAVRPAVTATTGVAPVAATTSAPATSTAPAPATSTAEQGP